MSSEPVAVQAANEWQMPERHPISIERARELIAGDLGHVYRDILAKTCAPIYWFHANRPDRSILHNGTITFVQTPERLLGVTAAHVLCGYLQDAAEGGIRVQIGNRVLNDLPERIISISEELDIATFAADNTLLNNLGKEIVPLGDWPPRPPQEGRGIMLAGYPAIERIEENGLNFGLFTALVISRRVTDRQITWLIEPEANVPHPEIPAPPPRYGLGGISGGPLISWFEGESHIVSHALSGIIIEHPNYEENDFNIERVVAVRADFIRGSGRVGL